MRRVSRNCLIAASFVLGAAVSAAAISTPDIAKKEHRMATVTNPINKGDRLQATASPHGAWAPSAKTTSAAKRPPFGCDPLFSPIANPAQAGLYRRCAV